MDSCSKQALHCVLFPVETARVAISSSETCASYLLKCKQNLLSEVWAFYHGKANHHQSLVCIDEMKRNTIYAVSPAEMLSELSWNLVRYGSHLYLLQPRAGERFGLRMLAGRAESCGPGVHVLGYVRPFLRELEAILTLLQQAQLPAILTAVAAPVRRTPFPFASPSCRSSAVPINDSQRGIVDGLASVLECIQGPPGTGKSTTIFHILHRRLPAGFRAVVTCMQNKAIDSIVEKLAPHIKDMPFVVCGGEERLGEFARRFTLRAQVDGTDGVAASLRQLRTAEAVLEQRLQEGAARGWPAFAKRLALISDLRRYRRECEAAWTTDCTRAGNRLQQSARAFLSTVDGLISAEIPKGRTILIVDEAGTVPEYKIPYLLTFGTEAIVAVGDQNQLRPFTYQGENVAGFFQRVVSGADPMLRVQYRMHPAICRLVSELFYCGLLETGIDSSSCGGVFWVDYAEPDAESRSGCRIFNQREVGLVANALPDLLAGGRSVSVLTFYKQQMVCLRERLGEHPNLRILTVDASQGSEADIVVLSCVRCNPKRILGFITDRHRLCVALSRARERLIVVGSRQTLDKDPIWRSVWQAAGYK